MLRTHKKPTVQVSKSPWTAEEIRAAKDYVADPANGYAIEFDKMQQRIKDRILLRMRERRAMFDLPAGIIGGKTGVQKIG